MIKKFKFPQRKILRKESQRLTLSKNLNIVKQNANKFLETDFNKRNENLYR